MTRQRSRVRATGLREYVFPDPPPFNDPERRQKIQAAFPRIDQILCEYRDSQHVPGMAFGVVVDGALAFSGALGTRELETNAPVTLETRFRIASMSKSFVAMAILRLRDAKKLRLDEPVAKYIPELKTLTYPTSDSPVLTLRHLLTMAPGFPEDNPWGDRQMAVRASTLTRWLRAGIPFSNAPGVNFEYSNYAYALLGRIITRVSGMKFQTYITRFILEPLRMEATTWDKRRVPREHFAQGYRWEDEQHRAEPVLADGAFAAMAGLFTTVPDFARYMIFLLDAFPPRSSPEKGPIKRATAREMQQLAIYSGLTQHTLPDGDAWSAVDGYGFGLSVWHDARFGYGVAHGGGLPGYGSYFYLLPDHGIGIVALSNKTYGAVGRTFPLLLQALAGTGSLTPRPVEPSAALVAMREVVQHWLEGGTDRELERVAADNFFLDHDLAHRRAERAQLRARLGPTLHVTGLEAPNALRGKWRIECETGTLQVALTLAPTMPPRLQALTLTPQFREPFDA